MSYFQKLDAAWSLDGLTPERCKGEFFVAYTSLSYYQLKETNSSLESLREKLNPTSVKWVESVSTVKTTPHVDHGISCSINFYVKPNRGLTLFFEAKSDAVPYSFMGETRSNLYTLDQLVCTGKFLAKPGEAFALNVAKIHTVVMPKIIDKRQFVQFSWGRLTYAELLEKVAALDVL